MNNHYIRKYWKLTSCGGVKYVNQNLEILYLVDYGWNVLERKLEPNQFEGLALSFIEDIDQEQNNLDA